MGVMVILSLNSVPWVMVPMVAISTVMQNGQMIRGTTDPLITKNKCSPWGRSLTIIPFPLIILKKILSYQIFFTFIASISSAL
jgi:hypothetical protein